MCNEKKSGSASLSLRMTYQTTRIKETIAKVENKETSLAEK